MTLDAVQFRQKCREYAAEQIQLQRRDFKRLGIIGDWDAPTKPLISALKPMKSAPLPKSLTKAT